MTPVLDWKFNALTVYMAMRLDWIAVDYDPYATLAEMRTDYKATGLIKVTRLHSENSIYGYEWINICGRAWHDYAHLAVNGEFSAEGESLAASYQMTQLRTLFCNGEISYREYDKFCRIVNAEVNGQVEYYMQHNSFPENGFQFTSEYLKCKN